MQSKQDVKNGTKNVKSINSFSELFLTVKKLTDSVSQSITWYLLAFHFCVNVTHNIVPIYITMLCVTCISRRRVNIKFFLFFVTYYLVTTAEVLTPCFIFITWHHLVMMSKEARDCIYICAFVVDIIFVVLFF